MCRPSCVHIPLPAAFFQDFHSVRFIIPLGFPFSLIPDCFQGIIQFFIGHAFQLSLGLFALGFLVLRVMGQQLVNHVAAFLVHVHNRFSVFDDVISFHGDNLLLIWQNISGGGELSTKTATMGLRHTKKRGTSFPVPLSKGHILAQSRISISLPQQTGMGSPALICSVRLQI